MCHSGLVFCGDIYLSLSQRIPIFRINHTERLCAAKIAVALAIFIGAFQNPPLRGLVQTETSPSDLGSLCSARPVVGRGLGYHALIPVPVIF